MEGGPSQAADGSTGSGVTDPGQAHDVQLRVELGQIMGKVDVVGFPPNCSLSGTTLRCDYGTLSVGSHTGSLVLKAKSGAPAGDVGQVQLEVTGRERSWHSQKSSGVVRINQFYAQGADISYAGTNASGPVGSVVTVSVTIRNNGPDVAPYVKVEGFQAAPGTEFAGGDGCGTTTSSFSCRVDNLQVGQSVTVRVNVRLLSCDPMLMQGWQLSLSSETAISDPIVNSPIYASVKVTGC